MTNTTDQPFNSLLGPIPTFSPHGTEAPQLSELGKSAIEYVQLGWHVFPLHGIVNGACTCSAKANCGSKSGKHSPLAHGVLEASNDIEQVARWWKKWPHANIGIHLGKSGMMVVDCDRKEACDGMVWLDAVESSIPDTLKVSTGGGGKHVYFKDPGIDLKGKIIDGVDLRHNGTYVVAPPSHHLSGATYTWDAGPEHSTPLAAVPDWLLDLCRADKPKTNVVRPDFVAVDSGHPWKVARISEIKSACAAIPPHDRDTWLRVGFAINAEFPDADGFAIWDDWAKGTERQNYNAKDQRYTWSKMQPGAGINVESLFAMANDNGWKGWKDETIVMVADVPAGPPPVVAPRQPSTQDKPFPPPLLRPPGLVGEIASWMDDCAPRETQLLSLAAAVSVVAAAIGRNYSTESGLRSNLQIMGVCPSGIGKENGRKCASKLMLAANIGDRIGGEEYTSASAVYNMVAENPTKLALIDEYGVILRAQQQSKVGQENLVSNAFVKLATTDIYHGTQYAEKDRKPVMQPHVVVYGTTTPTDFVRALSSTSVDGGFLGRLVIFQVDHGIKGRRWDAIPMEAPDNLVSALFDLASGAHISGLAGCETLNIGDSPKVAKKCFRVPCDAEADKMRRDLDELCVSRANADAKFGALWTRITAKAEQLALIIALGDIQAEPIIKGKHMAWGRDVAMWTTERLVSMLSDGMAESQAESDTQLVKNVLKKNGGTMTQNQLTRATQKIGNRRRVDALKELRESGLLIEGRATDKPGKPAIVYQITET